MDAYLDEHFDYAFAELLSFVTDIVDNWPRGRTAALFREWFEVRYVQGVRDLAGEPIKVLSAD